MRFRGAGFSDLGDKGGQEDRWAIAELEYGIVAAIADGMSDATGRGTGSNSAAVAEVACNFFVDYVSRELRDDSSLEEVITLAFRKTMERCEYTARALGGGATFVGVYLDHDGDGLLVFIGDSGAWEKRGSKWRSLCSVARDVDATGALTQHLGQPVAAISDRATRTYPIKGCDALVLGSDGLYGQTPDHERVFVDQLGRQDSLLEEPPFLLARDLVAHARHMGEQDNITAVVLAPAPEERSVVAGFLAPSVVGSIVLMAFLCGLLVGPKLAPILSFSPNLPSGAGDESSVDSDDAEAPSGGGHVVADPESASTERDEELARARRMDAEAARVADERQRVGGQAGGAQAAVAAPAHATVANSDVATRLAAVLNDPPNRCTRKPGKGTLNKTAKVDSRGDRMLVYFAVVGYSARAEKNRAISEVEQATIARNTGKMGVSDWWLVQPPEDGATSPYFAERLTCIPDLSSRLKPDASDLTQDKPFVRCKYVFGSKNWTCRLVTSLSD